MEPFLPSNISVLDESKGDCLFYSWQFTEPKENAKREKAVLVVYCNSRHDIAKDYYDHGYNVTMVQRSSDSSHDVTMKGFYAEDGVHFCASMPRSTLP